MTFRPLAGTLALLLGLAPAVRARDGDASRGAPVRENRLAQERSPYLRQHRTNPVDWFPWGPEALERARTEDRPIFLSIGYAACHWCHVMEHESFEDPEAARALNETFVCVKVDREERPDLDRLYMTSVQVLTGRGGWPMTVLLLPDGRPFWGGTYLPRASVIELSARVREAWGSQRAAIERQAASLAEETASATRGPALPEAEGSDEDLRRGLLTALAAAFDEERGGYGDRPKFPPHAELLFLLDRGGAAGGEDGLRQALLTLEAMAAGGIHDQVGGGFHRYATDERWFLPHFEKMLYDNALLARAYAEAHRVAGDRRFAEVARGALDWIGREMRRPEGGFASSLDADTDGHEGLTYTWTPAEIRAALPPDDAAFALRVFGVAESGNFREEATGRPSGRSLLHLAEPIAEADEPRAAAIRRRLLEARARRPQPGLDDKVVVAWNGLLLSAFAVAASALKDAAYLEDARRLGAFLVERCRWPDGTVLRFPLGSGPEIPGFCEDLVHLGEGLLDLAEATGEDRWTAAAREVADRLLADFEDPEAGGFFTASTTRHESLFARTKEVFDSPIPSDQGTAARFLLRLAARTGEARYRVAADRTLAAYRPLLAHSGISRGIVALHRALVERAALDAAASASARGDASTRVGPAAIDWFLERTEARRGGRVRWALRLVVDPGWHLNPPAPADPSLVATAVRLTSPSPVRLAAVEWPETGSGPLAGVVWIRGELGIPADAPPGPRRVSILLSFQPCDATSCRAPEEARLDAPLRFSDEDGAERHGTVFAPR